MKNGTIQFKTSVDSFRLTIGKIGLLLILTSGHTVDKFRMPIFGQFKSCKKCIWDLFWVCSLQLLKWKCSPKISSLKQLLKWSSLITQKWKLDPPPIACVCPNIFSLIVSIFKQPSYLGGEYHPLLNKIYHAGN